MKKKALIIIIGSLVLIVCLIAAFACMKPKVTGVKSLAAANIAAQSKVENFHMDGNVHMKVTLDSEEFRAIQKYIDPSLPIKMTLSADAGSETAHVTTKASVTAFGKSVTVKHAELYMDMKNRTAYTKAGESSKWKKVSDQDHQMNLKNLAGGIAIVGKTVLDNASYSESDAFYTLEIPAEKAGDLISDLHLISHVDLGIADLRDIKVTGGQIIYNVDKTTLLVDSIELEDVDVRAKGTYEDFSVNLIIPIDAVFQFSRYNELEESEYSIPAEVTGNIQ